MAKTCSHSPPKPVQFRLWGLLVVMTVVAIAAAVGAPFLRRYEAVELFARLTSGAIGVGIFGFSFVIGRRRRYKLTAECGALRFELPGCRYHPKAQSSLWSFSPVIALFAAAAFLTAFNESTTPISIEQFLYWTLSCGAFGLLYGFLIGLASRSRAYYLMAFCEEGVSLGESFVPWSSVHNATWLTEVPLTEHRLVLSLALGLGLGRIYLQVPAKDRVAIEEFVRVKTKFKD